jgi:hypothetical protein
MANASTTAIAHARMNQTIIAIDILQETCSPTCGSAINAVISINRPTITITHIRINDTGMIKPVGMLGIPALSARMAGTVVVSSEGTMPKLNQTGPLITNHQRGPQNTGKTTIKAATTPSLQPSQP